MYAAFFVAFKTFDEFLLAVTLSEFSERLMLHPPENAFPASFVAFVAPAYLFVF